MGHSIDTDGPWMVWGDSMQPLAEDVSHDEMKRIVDHHHSEGRYEIYGENNDTGEMYGE